MVNKNKVFLLINSNLFKFIKTCKKCVLCDDKINMNLKLDSILCGNCKRRKFPNLQINQFLNNVFS